MKLTGYVRDDKRVGFRNHIAIIPLAGCTQGVATKIADQCPDAVVISQSLGCDLWTTDLERLGAILYQLATGPNIGGVVFLTLSCAASNASKLPARTAETGRPVKTINLQLTGGTSACVAAGVEAVKEIAEVLKSQKRTEVPLSSIVMGTKCGASDETTHELCHPLVGKTCDMLVDAGAAVVLSEEYELYPAMETLAARAVDETTATELMALNKKFSEQIKHRFGTTVEDDWGDPKEAYKTSLARIEKAGTRPVQKVIPRGQLIGDQKGLVVLDGVSSDLIAMTSLAAAGCNLMIFTTGRGTLVAFPTVPTIKVTANEKTSVRMAENIDLLLTNDDSAKELFELVVAIANGQQSKGEIAGHGEMFIPIEGVTF